MAVTGPRREREGAKTAVIRRREQMFGLEQDVNQHAGKTDYQGKKEQVEFSTSERTKCKRLLNDGALHWNVREHLDPRFTTSQ